jgi:hypothetical protein
MQQPVDVRPELAAAHVIATGAKESDYTANLHHLKLLATLLQEGNAELAARLCRKPDIADVGVP